MNDRRVHARNHTFELVRYDRAGKWYAENPNFNVRTRLDIHRAAKTAKWLEQTGGQIFYGVPGGSTFDRLVKRA